MNAEPPKRHLRPSWDQTRIAFNRPTLTGREEAYLRQALESGHLRGDGAFTRRCHIWLERELHAHRALLTHSCTAALEMAALLCNLQPGDEVIMPSFTFVSTANAVVLRGAVPVFVDIRPDTLNLDERLIEDAITPRTRAIFPVHYAGVGCAMDEIMEIAARHHLFVVEDAAQGLAATHAGRPLGSIGHLAAISFHETKNVISGEGGALLVNDPALAARAEIIREKGTDRSRFARGEVDRYSWVDLGSSFLPSELIAAVLLAQLEQSAAFLAARRAQWNIYHHAFVELEMRKAVHRPVIPPACTHNAHLYYLLLPDAAGRTKLIADLHDAGIEATFHYVPLHDAPAGLRYGRAHGTLAETSSVSARLVRLPLWPGMEDRQEQVIAAVYRSLLT